MTTYIHPTTRQIHANILARDSYDRELDNQMIDYTIKETGTSPNKTIRVYFLYESGEQKCFDGRNWSIV